VKETKGEGKKEKNKNVKKYNLTYKQSFTMVQIKWDTKKKKIKWLSQEYFLTPTKKTWGGQKKQVKPKQYPEGKGKSLKEAINSPRQPLPARAPGDLEGEIGLHPPHPHFGELNSWATISNRAPTCW